MKIMFTNNLKLSYLKYLFVILVIFFTMAGKENKLFKSKIEYYKNGSKKSEKIFRKKKGKKSELKKRIIYYENGNKKEEQLYKNGKANGRGKSWYESGALKGSYSYKKNKPNGKGSYWYESGVLKNTFNYKDGKLSGKNIKTYLYQINKNIKYERDGYSIKITANKEIINLIKNDLKKENSFYFLEENEDALKIAINLVENTKKIPNGIKAIKGNSKLNVAKKVIKDYYFRTDNNSKSEKTKLKEFIKKIKLPEGYSIYLGIYKTKNENYIRTYVLKDKRYLDPSLLNKITYITDMFNNNTIISMKYNKQGSEILKDLTERMLNARIAMINNGLVKINNINQVIKDGTILHFDKDISYEESFKKNKKLYNTLLLLRFIKYIKVITK